MPVKSSAPLWRDLAPEIVADAAADIFCRAILGEKAEREALAARRSNEEISLRERRRTVRCCRPPEASQSRCDLRGGARTTRIDLTADPSGRPVAHRGPRGDHRERRGRRLICRCDRSLKGRQHKGGAEER
jgi:hypothetical protein